MDIICIHCNKVFKSYQSRCNHVRKYHKDVVDKMLLPVDNPLLKINEIILPNNTCNNICKYCNKKLSDRTSRWRHEKKCDNNKIDKLVEEMNKIKKDFKELSKINKETSVINNVTVNSNVNNGIVNNINSLGYENILSKLSEKEKIRLLTGIPHQEYPIIELVRKIYTNDSLKENRNTLLTNLRSKDCLIYNSDINKFDATNKNEHINNIIENRKHDIASMYNEFNDSKTLKPKERKSIEDYLEKIECIDKKDKKLKAFYEKHKEEIIYIIYNCKEFMSTIKDNLSSLEDDNNIEL